MTATIDAPLDRVQRSRRPWPGPVLGLGVVLAVLGGGWLAVGPGGRSMSGLLTDNVLNSAVNGIEFGIIAAVLLALRPANRLGWLLMYIATANALAILGEGWALATYHLDLPGRTFMAWLASWIWATVLILGATVLPAIYPSGRTTSRTARGIVRAGWASSLVVGAALALLDDPYHSALPGHRLGHNPLSHGSYQALATGVAGAAAIFGFATVLFSLGWTLRRLWRSSSPEREQLGWLLVSVLPAIVAPLLAPPLVLFVVTLFTSAALVVGILGHQLFDIRVALRSGLVHGLLIALALAGYVGTVGLITLVTPPGIVPSLFAAAAVALLVRPVYAWLERAVGRMVYGDRADPVRALSRVGRELQTGSGAEHDLDAMLAAIAASIRSPHVAVRSDRGALIAEAGHPNGHPTHQIELRHAGCDLGVLAIAWRTPADDIHPADRRLVHALAAPVAVAVRAAQLADEVSQSRARVIAVRETERRQLRNDLHDGIGPSLSGVALGIEAALKAGAGDKVTDILRVVHDEISRLVTEVRHLIDDLGPTVLFRGGLVTALRSHAEAVSALGDLQIQVVAGPLPDVPEPVEAALHRIASEALTNVVRHAGATHATIRIATDDHGVRLSVADDGCGVGDAPPGVGHASMRDRAESVGGTLTICDRPGGGTLLVADVPVHHGDHGG